MKSKENLYLHLNRVFSFPHYFGNNLDALWDFLNESDEPTRIEFLNVALAREQLGAYGEKLIQLFEKLAENTENYVVSFQ